MYLSDRIPFLQTFLPHAATWGELALIQEDIAARWIHNEDQILDIRCGSAHRAQLFARRGGETTGIDHSLPMIRHARHVIHSHNLSSYIRFVCGTIPYSIRAFKNKTFDIIIAPFVMGPLEETARNRFLDDCRDLLKQDGTLIIIEKVKAPSRITRFLLPITDIPLTALTQVLTGVPMKPLNSISSVLNGHPLTIHERRDFLFGTLQVCFIQKADR